MKVLMNILIYTFVLKAFYNRDSELIN